MTMKSLIKIALFLTTLTLIACGGGSSGGGSDAPITPAPTKTALSIADASSDEGENITFTVTSTPNIAKAISFRYQVNFTGAANASDLSGSTTGEVTIAPNESNATIEIPIANDNLTEPNETFQIQLSDLSPTSDATFTNKTATGTILANEPIKISIADASGDEGSPIVFNVTATKNLANPIVFNYTIDFTGQTASASDLISGQLTGTSTIATNDSNTTISIPIFDDSFKESNETFQIQLSAQLPLGTVFTKNTAIGTIKDNDPDGIVAISVQDAEGNEGENITFKVTSGLVKSIIRFTYRIDFAGQTNPANADDFIGNLSKDIAIATNDSSVTISISLADDTQTEPNETFRVVLSSLFTTDATFTKSTAIGTILANDPQIRIADATASEGENIIFTVTANPPIAEQISFNYQVDFDNTQDLDSASTSDLSGTTKSRATIDANNTTTTIEIRTVNDTLREKAEGFSVIFSDLTPTDATFGVDNIKRGTILASDNDASGRVIISLVANAQASEDSGTINFKVTSEFPAISAFTFNYAVVLDNPTTPNSANFTDFDATTGTATIPVDASSTTIRISIVNDDTIEPDETFSLQLTPTSPNAILANNLATGTILNDDLGEISNATAIIGDTAITLNWTNPNSNIFAGVTIAQITGATPPNENCSSGTTNNVLNVTNHPITGLITGSTHSFRICARSTTGSLSGGFPLTNLIPQPTVDNNGNGLIDIANPTQFNNIRHNLDATSYKTSGTAAGFTRGCPNNICNGYELTANITLSGTWNPIGSSSDRFTAIFDGKNKTISNLTITGNNYVGLFSATQNATISNLKLATVSVTGAGNVGALIGDATNSTLSNIELIGDESQTEITGNGANIGGLVGMFAGTITDASSSLTVRGGNSDPADNTGGLVGQLAGGSIKNSNSSGSVSSSGGADNVGGLVGQTANNTTISNSWASGNVSSFSNINGNQHGGLVGFNNGAISNSWASGNISSTGSNTSYGGLVGNNIGAISNSWTSGNVLAPSNAFVGGLVGFNPNIGVISNSWASGEFAGNNVGGLVGQSFGNINGRNYRLSDGANNIGTKLATTDLAALSGATGDTETTHSDWHAGFGSNLFTQYCDTDDDGTIDVAEQVATNSVWVMSSTSDAFPIEMSDNVPAPMGFYAIPAIRCIANTADATNDTEIDRRRKIEIDRQRRLFPTN